MNDNWQLDAEGGAAHGPLDALANSYAQEGGVPARIGTAGVCVDLQVIVLRLVLCLDMLRLFFDLLHVGSQKERASRGPFLRGEGAVFHGVWGRGGDGCGWWGHGGGCLLGGRGRVRRIHVARGGGERAGDRHFGLPCLGCCDGTVYSWALAFFASVNLPCFGLSPRGGGESAGDGRGWGFGR